MERDELPTIRHAYEHHHLAAGRWLDFETRDGDVVISTSYKAGTTWMQTIVGTIIFHETGLPDPISKLSPWLDMRLMPEAETKAALAAQKHQRFVKTHLPLDGLPYHRGTRYIVVGRDPRDVFMSVLNHWGNLTDTFFDALNDCSENPEDRFPRMPEDARLAWHDWITRGWFPWESDGWPWWSHLHHCASWWEFRHLPNIAFFHFADMLEDLEREMRRVADHIGVNVPEAEWPRLVDACRFDYMKKESERLLGDMSFAFKGGTNTFMNRGTNGRWRDLLTEEDIELYRDAMARTLEPACARWLESGGATD